MKKLILAAFSRILDFASWLNRECLKEGEISQTEHDEKAQLVAQYRADIVKAQGKEIA